MGLVMEACDVDDSETTASRSYLAVDVVLGSSNSSLRGWGRPAFSLGRARSPVEVHVICEHVRAYPRGVLCAHCRRIRIEQPLPLVLCVSIVHVRRPFGLSAAAVVDMRGTRVQWHEAEGAHELRPAHIHRARAQKVQVAERDVDAARYSPEADANWFHVDIGQRLNSKSNSN